MLAAIKNKITGKRGVTLLLALLMFLVCAVVGSVVVGAAYTTAARVTRDKNAQQSYLAVMSAARLFEEQFAEMSFEIGYVKTVTDTRIPIYGQVPKLDENGDAVLDENGDPVYEEGIVGYDQISEETYKLVAPELLGNSLFAGEVISELVSAMSICYQYYHTTPEVYDGAVPQNCIENIFISVDGLDIPDVKGNVTVCCKDSDNFTHFDVVITLSDESGANSVLIRFPAEIVPTYDVETNSYENSTVNKFTYGMIVTWSVPQAEKGGAA